MRDVETGQFIDRPMGERFWEKVDVRGPDECWEWQAYKCWGGYGQFRGSNSERVIAHRMSWILNHGDIPDGKCVLHKCDNPGCVNPKHLFLGTQKDNMQDAANKGRTHLGEAHGNSRLTEKEVRTARRLYAKGGISIRALGRRFGVGNNTIWEAIRRITWKHV